MFDHRWLSNISVLTVLLAVSWTLAFSPPPVAAGREPIRVEGDVVAPKVIKKIAPKYTEEARKAGITGHVILRATIDEQGRVKDAEVLQTVDAGLDAAALAAVRQWQFEPATYQGRPVAVYYNLTINFQLAEKMGLKKVGGSVSAPTLIEKQPPKYPETARKDKIEGIVGLRLHLNAEGGVTAAKVLESVREDVDAAAVEAVHNWRFEPAMEDGQPVAVIYDVTLKFDLQ